jgi:hypothetical protein
MGFFAARRSLADHLKISTIDEIVMLGPLLRTLFLKMAIVEDHESLERYRDHRVKRDEAQARHKSPVSSGVV